MISLRVGFLLTLLVVCSCVVDRTYYTYLGLDITASIDQISAAYSIKKEKLASVQQEETRNSKLKLLEEAYGVLGNAQKRLLYDRLNRELLKKESVVSNLKRLTDKSARKAKPILFTLPVSTEDVYHGKIIEATFLKQTACDKCKGTGAESPKFLNPCPKCVGAGFSVFEGANQFGQKFTNQNTCQICQGTGKQITKLCPICSGKKIVSKMEKVKIKVPKGLPDGNVIRINNFGDEPTLGAPSDLEVTIVEIPTQKWSREGENIIHYVPISLSEAIFGFSKTIQHLSGEQIQISRKEVTTSLTTMTLPNQGIQNLKTGSHGKLIIRFRIIMPKFTDKQLDMWEQFFKKHNL